MKKFLTSWINKGVLQSHSMLEASRIKFTNGVALLIMSTLLSFLPIHVHFELWTNVLSTLPLTGFFLLVIFFSSKQAHERSKLCLVLGAYASVAFYSYPVIDYIKSHWLFLPYAILPLILFTNHNGSGRWALSAIAAVLFTFYEYFLPHQPLNQEIDSAVIGTKFAIQALVFGLVALMVQRLILEHTHSIQEQEKTNRELMESEQVIQDSLAKSHSLMATLEDQKSRMDLALKASGIGIWEYDILFQELTWDKGMFSIFGLKPKEFDGKFHSFRNLILEEDREQFLIHLNSAIDQKRDLNIELRIHHPKEQTRTIRLIAQLFFNAQDELHQMLGACWDISAQKEQEKLLLHTQDLLEKTSEIAKVGGWELDLEKNFMLWSKEVNQMLQVPPSFSPSPDSALNFVHPSERRRVMEMMDNCINQKEPWNQELTLHTFNSETIHVRSYGVPVIQDEEVIAIRGAYQDITELKQAKKEREMFFNLSQDLFCIMDFDGQFLYTNPSWVNTLGWEIEELQNSFLADFLHDSERDSVWNEIESLQSGTSSHKNFQCRLKTKDGKFRWLSWSSNALSEQKLLYSVARDVTEEKQYESELIQAKEDALNAARAKSVFLSTMSHEIRTPMNAVIGMSQLLLDETPRPDQQENLKILNFSAKNLLALINDILDYNKIESGQLLFDLQPFNLIDLMKAIRSTFQTKCEEQGTVLQVQLDDKIPQVVRGDATRLTQVINNLVSNAVKFTENGLVMVLARIVESDQDRLMLEISVRDTGIGIAQDKLASIFDNFTQADATINRRFGGTGLGLSISKKLVEMQGGKIWVESETGIGSTFYVHQPFDIIKDEGVKSHAIEENPVDFERLKGLKILVADDNRINVTLAKKILTKKDILVGTASDGKEALIELQKNSYDLILMDIQMPNMDGYEASMAIRKLPEKRLSQIPIIALSADVLDDVQTQVKESGMDGYLSKPLNPKKLFQTILDFTDQS